MSIAEERWKRWAECAVRRIERDKPQCIAYDTETTGVGFYDEAFAATLTWRRPSGEMQSAYLGLETGEAARDPDWVADEDEARIERVEMLGNILRSVPEWIFWNAKFDLQKSLLMSALEREDIEASRVNDGATVFALINENDRKALKSVAPVVLGDSRDVIGRLIPKTIKSGKRKGEIDLVPKEKFRLDAVRKKLKLTKDDGYHLLPRPVIVPYAIRDTIMTLRLFEVLMPRLERIEDPRLLEIYAERMELKLALLDMEADGLGLDMPYLDETTSQYGVRVMDGWSDVVRLVGDSEFNPGSPQQILAAFERRGITLENTQASTLNLLDDDLAKTLVQYRDDQKNYKVYLRGVQNEQRNGIIHPNFNDDAARTGRMSSSTASNN